MKEEDKTKEELILELTALRKQVSELEKLKTGERTGKKLQESEEYFRAITENSSDIIFILDRNGSITYASPSVERFLGYRPEELLGKSSLYLILPDEHPRAISDFAEAVKIKEVLIPNAFRVRHKDGSERILEGVGKNLLDNTAVAGFVMNVRDVSQRKKAENEREELIRELKKALSEIKTLSGLLPICSSCKKIRDDDGYWKQIESYISAHSEAEFSHSICPDCMTKLYPQLVNK